MKYPLCEECGKHEAVSLSWFHEPGASYMQPNGIWKLACYCTRDTESYYVYLDDFFSSECKQDEWISHLSCKGWMDLNDFNRAVERVTRAAA